MSLNGSSFGKSFNLREDDFVNKDVFKNILLSLGMSVHNVPSIYSVRVDVIAYEPSIKPEPEDIKDEE